MRAAIAAALGMAVAYCIVSPVPADGRQTAGGEAGVASLFYGNYELVRYETLRGTEFVDMNYVGRIMYDEHGNMSAIGMPRDLPDRVAAAEPGEGMPRAGFAYFAVYEVFPEDGRVVHRVGGSPMNGSWVGRELVRYFEFSEGHLTLSLRDAAGQVTGRLVWRRLP